MGLTADVEASAPHLATTRPNANSGNDSNFRSLVLGTVANPNIICDPGVGCGTKVALETISATSSNGTTVTMTVYVNSSTGQTVGCIIGTALGGAVSVSTGGFFGLVLFGTTWQGWCHAGGWIAQQL